jgi:transcriptional regulator of heat shock response
VENHGSGKLAILGPANMDYLQMLELLQKAALELEESMNEYYRYMDTLA